MGTLHNPIADDNTEQMTRILNIYFFLLFDNLKVNSLKKVFDFIVIEPLLF
jgi:hypothetical protein